MKLKIIARSLKGFYKRIRAYQRSSEQFQCQEFVDTVSAIDKIVKGKTGLKHYCQFNWYIKNNGVYEDAMEKMPEKAAYICDYVAKNGHCPRNSEHYCEEKLPCIPHCEKCSRNLNKARVYLNYASKQLSTCHLPLQNVLKNRRDVTILVIPDKVDESYLENSDGSSQVSATINAPENNYADYAAHALVNGELHIFGGSSDGYKVQFCKIIKLKKKTAFFKKINNNK